MTAIIIDGKKIANEITKELKAEVRRLKYEGITPKLVNISYRPDERSLVYIKMKQRRAEELGVAYEHFDLTQKSQQDCQVFLTNLAMDDSVHGIIVQLPINGWLDPQILLNLIPIEKDVDGLSDQSLVDLGNNQAVLAPATPLAILELLKRAGIDIRAKTVAIVGQGKLVGLPLSLILQNMGVDVLTADIKTPNLADVTTRANVVVSATGQPNLINADLIAEDAIIVDAGIMEMDGKLKGDVDIGSVKAKASMISPVPGGIGPMTVVMVLKNTVEAAKRQFE